MARPLNASVIGSPFLSHVGLHEDRVVDGEYPFTIRSIMRGLPLSFSTPVTFLVGENGSGKSTLLEALAWALGFSDQGGDRTNAYAEGADGHALGRALALGWRKRVSGGFFLRAETFFNYARHLEELAACRTKVVEAKMRLREDRFSTVCGPIAALWARKLAEIWTAQTDLQPRRPKSDRLLDSAFSLYDGVPLNQRSHGEAFLALFQNRFEDGTYLLDEPEAALSPSRQLAFLSVLHDLGKSRVAQLIIATHSPILLSLPGARVLHCDDAGINEVDYRDTEHFQLTRDFLNAPERYFRHLFDADEEV